MTVETRTPSTWGDINLTRDRLMYMKEMETSNFFSNPDRLVGFAVGAPEMDEREAVKVSLFEYVRGYVRERVRTMRKTTITGYNFSLQLPPGSTWSNIDKIANNRGLCRRDFFVVNPCSSNTDYSHFYRYTKGILDEIRQENNLITTVDDEESLTRTTMLHAEAQKLYWRLRLTERATDATADPIFGLAWGLDDCANCIDDYQDATYGGGDGTNAVVAKNTTNRFTSASALTTGIASGSIITSIYRSGSRIVATFSDENATSGASSVAGGIIYSFDGGTTISTATSPTTGMYAVTYGNGYYWAVGDQGLIYRSQNMITWSAYTNPLAASTLVYTCIAYDPKTTYLYLGGFDGAASRAHRIQDGTVSNITTEVNAGNNLLYGVAVLEEDHVVYVGASGTIRENPSASGTDTYTTGSAEGTTADLHFVGGDKARTIVAGGTKVYERSFLTDLDFRALSNLTGTTITGNIVGGTQGDHFDGANYFAFGTDIGELVVATPVYPEA